MKAGLDRRIPSFVTPVPTVLVHSLVAFLGHVSNAALVFGSGDSAVVERRTGDQNVKGSIHNRSGERLFFSRVNFLC